MLIMNSNTGEYRFSRCEVYSCNEKLSENNPSRRSRHVILPAALAKQVPKAHLMTESEWRNLGIQQSPGEKISMGIIGGK